MKASCTTPGCLKAPELRGKPLARLLHRSAASTARRTPSPRVRPPACTATPIKPPQTPDTTVSDASPRAVPELKPGKLRVAVLGSGWGAVSFLRNIDPKLFGADGPYELVLISPRNYFLFTPLLPSAMVGSVEERSIASPIRNIIHGKGTYYEAACIDINPEARVLTCKRMEQTEADGFELSEAGEVFTVPYDLLLMGVGSVNNTFGIQGVEEHCWFMKTMEDARKLRVHISKTIEQAGLPSTTPAQRRKMLNFVVVGGGPTGVEVAAELHDLVTEDVARLFPHIKDDVSITLVDGLDKVLSSFSPEVSNYAGKSLDRQGVHLKLSSTVRSVGDGHVCLKDKDGSTESIGFGTCVWATGIATHPLVSLVRSKLGEEVQGNPRGLLVDSHLRVKGSQGSIIAIGDAAITNQVRALKKAMDLFEIADLDKDGNLSKRELIALLAQVKPEFPQLGDLLLHMEASPLAIAHRTLFPSKPAEQVYLKHKHAMESGLDLEQFTQLLTDIDSSCRPLPPTAQVARQQGSYLASLFDRQLVVKEAPAEPEQLPLVKLAKEAYPFVYVHLGSLAYLGMNCAVMQLPTPFPMSSLKGWLGAHIWRALELYLQVSVRNRWMVSNDWLRTKFFGRNISDLP